MAPPKLYQFEYTNNGVFVVLIEDGYSPILLFGLITDACEARQDMEIGSLL